tara:strand:+ start:988 stop:1281 length:294 start_codon:yes stop_codon:yes gene_type:complete
MSTRLTADKARELAGRTVEEAVDSILVSIEAKAKKKSRELKTGWEHKEDNELWERGGYATSEDWKEAKATLEGLGYTVTFFYEERQFVNMYTLITWK